MEKNLRSAILFKKPYFLELLLFLFIINACEQENTPEINDLAQVGITYGGSQIDVGYFGQQTKDGGFIITGLTRSYSISGSDIWLIKTDHNGEPEWDEIYGGIGEDYGLCVRELDNGGYIIVGSALVKTQTQGSEDWINEDISGNAVQIASDGGFIVTGTMDNDISIIKTDSYGTQLWSKVFNIKNIDIGYSIEPTIDGGFIIAGCIDCESYSDLIIMKINELGDTLWTKTYGGYQDDVGAHSIQTSDLGYIVTGQTSSYGNGVNDLWLIKTDASGDSLWTRLYGGSSLDEGSFVQQTSDNGYIITGINFSQVLPDYGDAWLVKTDSVGIKLWEKTFGGLGLDWGRTVQQTSDGGYALTGWREIVFNGEPDSQVWLILTDSEGETYSGD